MSYSHHFIKKVLKLKSEGMSFIKLSKKFYIYSGEFFRTVFSQKIDVKLSKIFSILTFPKYTSAGVL